MSQSKKGWVIDNKLYRAVEQSNWEKVQEILQKPGGQELAKTSEGNGYISLHLAIFNEAPDVIIEALIDANKKSVRRKSKRNKWLPLHISVCYGASSCVVEKLIWMYPDALEKKDYIGKTPRDYLYLKKLDKRGEVLVSSFKRHEKNTQNKFDKSDVIDKTESRDEQNMFIVTNNSSGTEIRPSSWANNVQEVPVSSVMNNQENQSEKVKKSVVIEKKESYDEPNMMIVSDDGSGSGDINASSSNDDNETKEQKRNPFLFYDDQIISNSSSTSVEPGLSLSTAGSMLHSMGEGTCRDLQEEINVLDTVVNSYAKQLHKYKYFNSVLQQENHELRENVNKLNGDLVRMDHKQKVMMNNATITSNGKARSLFLHPCS